MTVQESCGRRQALPGKLLLPCLGPSAPGLPDQASFLLPPPMRKVAKIWPCPEITARISLSWHPYPFSCGAGRFCAGQCTGAGLTALPGVLPSQACSAWHSHHVTDQAVSSSGPEAKRRVRTGPDDLPEPFTTPGLLTEPSGSVTSPVKHTHLSVFEVW